MIHFFDLQAQVDRLAPEGQQGKAEPLVQLVLQVLLGHQDQVALQVPQVQLAAKDPKDRLDLGAKLAQLDLQGPQDLEERLEVLALQEELDLLAQLDQLDQQVQGVILDHKVQLEILGIEVHLEHLDLMV